MIKIPNSFEDNSFIRRCLDTIFTVLLTHTLIKYSDKFKNIRSASFIHGLLDYPGYWHSEINLFRYLSEEALSLLQKKKAFFIFDSSTEGFDPTTREFPAFDFLYHNCKEYKVDPSMIIYISSNLRDEENIKKYAEERGIPPLNVFSFLSFEQVINIDENRKDKDMIDFYNQAVSFCNIEYADKYFSSLSRINRRYRTVGTFLLCQSNISKKAFISHDKIDTDYYEYWITDIARLSEFTEKEIFRWTKSLPLTVDRNDFKNNWAIHTPYRHIHDRTLFQIVNETLVDSSMFYSEKTFRPISYFQPFIIYGQQGCNHFLKDIGYQTYEEWFDLSFDFEEDPVLRYRKLLVSITETCKILDGMNRNQQIEWRFKNQELLANNFNVMRKSQYSRDKLVKFLDELDHRYASNQ